MQPGPDRGAIDRFVVEQMAAQRVPGLALAITRGDQVLYVQGYGTAGRDRPVTPQTQFLIASLSKSFTALAVMQLVEAGKLDLDVPVQSYLPDLVLADPAAAAQITIRQLLNQTSGLADAGFPAMRLPQPATPAERIASLRTARLVARPGTEYHYHDVNYQILARVVEVAGGQPFSDYLQAHVLAPLRMTRTLSALTSSEALARADGLAMGHLFVFGMPIAAREEPGFFAGSGGIVSTAEDMAWYLIAQTDAGRFEGRELVSPAGMALMHTPPPNIEGGYAMGWSAAVADGVPVLEHNGILSTFYADMVLLPESGYGMALLYNIHSLAQVSVGFPRIKRGLIAILAGRQPQAAGPSTGTLEIVFGLLTLAGVALGIRSLLRLPAWVERADAAPVWRLVPGIVWKFVPAALVLAVPAVVLQSSGRAFGLVTLVRAMPEVMTWLGLAGFLGAIDGTTRLAILATRGRRSSRRAIPRI